MSPTNPHALEIGLLLGPERKEDFGPTPRWQGAKHISLSPREDALDNPVDREIQTNVLDVDTDFAV
jgi:hypothetical protein